MSTISTRIVRLCAASALVLGLGALAAGPARATSHHGIYGTTTGSALLDDAGPEGIGRGSGIASTDLPNGGTWSG